MNKLKELYPGLRFDDGNDSPYFYLPGTQVKMFIVQAEAPGTYDLTTLLESYGGRGSLGRASLIRFLDIIFFQYRESFDDVLYLKVSDAEKYYGKVVGREIKVVLDGKEELLEVLGVTKEGSLYCSNFSNSKVFDIPANQYIYIGLEG